jgi:hypothetical protein
MTYNNWSRCVAIVGLMLCSVRPSSGQVGQTEITKWRYGKNGAVSLTYDDGSINQFRVAVPIMDGFGFPATFFIVTGQIPGSQYRGTFIGRPTKAIIEETATVPTDKGNFFERASALAFLGYQGTTDYQTRAGETYDEEKDFAKAYRIIDDAYAKVVKERSNQRPRTKPPQIRKVALPGKSWTPCPSTDMNLQVIRLPIRAWRSLTTPT